MIIVKQPQSLLYKYKESIEYFSALQSTCSFSTKEYITFSKLDISLLYINKLFIFTLYNFEHLILLEYIFVYDIVQLSEWVDYQNYIAVTIQKKYNQI